MSDWFFNLIIIGLSFDIVGVILIAVGVFWKSEEDIAEEAGTFFGANPYVVRSLAKSQIDTIFGLFFLVSGFFLQILGTLKIYPPEKIVWCLWGLLFLVLIVYITDLRNLIIDKRIQQVEEVLKKERGK